MNYSKAIEIAPNIYWVGYVIPDDPFQCHVYLIKNGNESILIDPGSMITFPVVLEKITSILPLRDIKYIIMHHQDPDIVGCFATLETLFPKGERYIVTHWRTQMLLKHYQWKTHFYLIDEHEWKLKANDRELEFVFTPYAHFPGAFATYDKKSQIMFSSDLFGGLTPEFELFAKNADEYFEYAKPFHQHYIPNKEILNYAIDHIKVKDISMIAPQHGSIIKKELINPFLDKLSNLDCGLYLMDDYVTDLDVLSKIDDIFKKFLKDAVSSSSFKTIIKNLFIHLEELFPSISKIKVCGKSFYSNKEYCFQYENFELTQIQNKQENFTIKKSFINEEKKEVGEIFLFMDEKLDDKNKKYLDVLFRQLETPLATSLEKEIMIRELEINNKELYEKSIKDALTNLYNREFMNDFLNQKIKESNRYNIPLSIAMIDIDFFKRINDTYGHVIGDCVLKELSNMLLTNFRKSDTVVRYGGEEILVIMPFTTLIEACEKMENFRKMVENYLFCGKKNIHMTISIGVAELKEEKNKTEFIKKADTNLYAAKESGRNRVICKEEVK